MNKNVQITHDRLITLENRTAMMAKAIIPVLKDFKENINSTNKRLTRQYRMMIRAHDRYNTLFRQTHNFFQIHHLALLMFKDYIMILVGTLQRIHRQYIRYESALDVTLIGIENLNSGYLTHCILDPQVIMIILRIAVVIIIMYFCCTKCRHTRTILKYCFPFLPISCIVCTSHHTDLFVEVTNITKGKSIWAHFTVT